MSGSFNSRGERRHNALEWLDYAARVRERIEAGENVSPIERSLAETVERVAAEAFDKGIPR